MTAAIPAWTARLYALLFLALPWTFPLSFGKWSVEIPAEPILAICGLSTLIPVWKCRRALWGDPLMRLAALVLLWLCVAAVFSTMPLVSAKFMLITLAHAWVFGTVFRIYPGLLLHSFRFFLWSLAGVVAYTIWMHARLDFRSDQALLAPMPFFPEHNLYATVVAMAIPLLWLPGLQIRKGWKISAALSAWFALGLAVAGSRAALSAALIALLAAGILRLKPGRRIPVAVGVLCIGVLVSGLFYGRIAEKVPSDVSLQERINRWDCAWRMAADRPLTGYGPGVFQFAYLSYQRPERMTRISVTEPVNEHRPDTYGRGGGAHSLYAQLLAEAGWPALLAFLALVVYYFVQIGKRGKAPEGAVLALVVAIFLLVSTLHDVLHDVRIAALWWPALVLATRNAGLRSGRAAQL